MTLQRTAERKFLRLDIDAADDLAGGFPKTREELYAYRGLVLGSIEAGAFTPDQLRMMADFVSLRGGGLLALGGRRAFAEGGYGGTPVAEALPVELGAAKAADTFLETLQVRPTRLGQTHVATQIGATEQASAERWASLPPLTSVNPVRRVKPGAAVLLDRPRRQREEAGGAGVPAIRRRQGHRVPGAGLVACGRCTPTSRSRTRPTRRSGGGCCAGSSTACRNGWR